MFLSLNTQILVWILLLFAAVSLYVFWSCRQLLRQLSRGTGFTLTVARILAMGLLLFFVCEPVVSLVLERAERGSILLLTDTSGSMNLSDKAGSRREAVSDLLSGSWFGDLSSEYDVTPLAFAESVVPMTPEDFDSLRTVSAATDLGAALLEARKRSQRNEISGVVLISDGNHTVGRDPARIVDRVTTPVYVIGIGDTTEIRDTAVVGHTTNDIGYVDSRIPVEVTIQSRGYDGVKIPVTLKEGGRVLNTRQVVLSGGGRRQSTTLFVVPSNAGAPNYSVSIPHQDGESVLLNNTRDFSIKVLNSKLSVLYIEGSARADITFLNTTMKRDPNIDATSLLAKPDGGFYPKDPPRQLSDWLQYDLVILGSISHSRIQPWANQILSFVEQKGGGLVALGGPQSFELGEYAGTAIGNMMPVRIPSANRGLLEGLYLPVLTVDGEAHAITRIHDDIYMSSRRWTELPPLTGINQLGPAKAGATVLAVHPTWKIGGQESPIMAVHQYGLGKVMSISTYDLWRWDLMMWGGGGTNESYVRFWSNVVRWMTTREGGKRLRVTTAKPSFGSGEPIAFSGQLYDGSFRPVDNGVLTLTVVPDADKSRVITVAMSASPYGSGRYQAELANLQSGKYTFRVSATGGGQQMGTDTGVFEVGQAAIEYMDTGMDMAVLTSIAERTGGRFYPAEDADLLIDEIEIPANMVSTRDEIRIWNHPASLIVLVAVLTLEWLVRRRQGLL